MGYVVKSFCKLDSIQWKQIYIVYIRHTHRPIRVPTLVSLYTVIILVEINNLYS